MKTQNVKVQLSWIITQGICKWIRWNATGQYDQKGSIKLAYKISRQINKKSKNFHCDNFHEKMYHKHDISLKLKELKTIYNLLKEEGKYLFYFDQDIHKELIKYFGSIILQTKRTKNLQ